MKTMREQILNNKFFLFLVYAIFFTLPFERIPTKNFGGFTVKLSYIFALLLLVGFLFVGLFKLFREQKFSKSDWVLVLFWLVGTSTLYKAVDKKESVMIVLMWAFVFVVYFILSRLLTDSKTKRTIENIILISTILVCLFGLYQFVGDSLGLAIKFTGLRLRYTKEVLGFPRIQATALEPLYFANFLTVPLFIVLRRYFIESKKVIDKYFWAIVLIFLSIILAVSRGAYLAIGITFLILFVYLICVFKNKIYKKIIGFLGAIILSILLAGCLVKFLDGGKNVNNFVNHATVNDSTNAVSVTGREAGYQTAIDKFYKSPVFGIGIGNSSILPAPVVDHGETFTRGTVNNEYLEILSETGIVGLISFFAFLFLIIYEIYPIYKTKNAAEKLGIVTLFLGLLAIFIQYNFFSTLYIIYIWAFLAMFKSETYKAEPQN